jgi:hypothetical protein
MTATILPIRDEPTPTTTGQTLIALVRDLIRAHGRANDDDGPMQKAQIEAAWNGTCDVARATAFVPIESRIEALAQVVFLDNELEGVLAYFSEEDDQHPSHIASSIQALRARPILLARWMEREFGIQREDHELNFFASDELGLKKHLPHLVGAV